MDKILVATLLVIFLRETYGAPSKLRGRPVYIEIRNPGDTIDEVLRDSYQAFIHLSLATDGEHCVEVTDKTKFLPKIKDVSKHEEAEKWRLNSPNFIQIILSIGADVDTAWKVTIGYTISTTENTACKFFFKNAELVPATTTSKNLISQILPAKYLFVRAQIREGTVTVNEETGWNCTGFLEETDIPDEMLIFPTKKHNSDSDDLTPQQIKDGLLNNQNLDLILAYAWDEDLAIADHIALQNSYDEKLHVIIGLTLVAGSLTEEINDFTKHFVSSSTNQLMKFAFENRQDEKILQLYDVSSVVLLQWKSNNTYYVGPSKLVLTGRMKILKDIKVLSILPNLDNSYLVNKFLYGFGNPKEMLAIRLNDPSSEENNNPWNLVGEPIFDKQRETWRVSFRVETTLTSYSKYKPMYTEDTLKIIPEDRQNLSQYTLFEGENSEYSQSFRKVVADDTVVPLFKGEALFNYEERTSTELKELSFTCCEQSMMFYKVLMFDPENKNMIDLIMDLKKKPADIKALGGKVKNFNTEFWKEINLDIIYLGNELKFTQNEDLKNKIIGVTGMGFGEISDNKTYGTGYKTLAEHDKSRANWPGLNQLGELLKKLRDNIENSDVYYNKDPNQRG